MARVGVGCDRAGSSKKSPAPGGASDPLHRFERPGGSLSARAERAFRIQSAQRCGTSRHHEHLNFPAETFGADAPASIARPACSSTRHVVPDTCNKLAAVVTRARVDPLVSVGMSFQAQLLRITVSITRPAKVGNYCSDGIFSTELY